VIERNERDTDGCSTVEDPLSIRPCHENVSSLLDPFQSPLVLPPANRLSREKTGSLDAPAFDCCSRAFERVADEVGLPGNPPVIHGEQSVAMIVAEFATEELAAEKGRVSDDEVRVRPWLDRWDAFAIGVE